MIAQGLKNYIKNLKFVFNPLGTIALGFVFGLSILIPVIMSSANTLVESVKSIFSNANIDLTALKESVVSAFQALNWSEPLEAIKLMLSRDWLMQTLQMSLSTFVESMDVYTVPLTAAIDTFCISVFAAFVGLIMFVILVCLSNSNVVIKFCKNKFIISKVVAKATHLREFCNN